MPPRDPDPELAHPEAAGWVLGILDPDDADQFRRHVWYCRDCQAAVAELGPAARLLQTAAPAAAPQAGLQARTLAGVTQAAAAARRGERHSRWRGWNVRMLALAAAVVFAAAVSAGLLFPARRPQRPIPLRCTPSRACRRGPGRLGPGGRDADRQRLVDPAHRRPPRRPGTWPVL